MSLGVVGLDKQLVVDREISVDERQHQRISPRGMTGPNRQADGDTAQATR